MKEVNAMSKFVCTNNPDHVFDTNSVDGFCFEAECYGVGFLIEAKDDPSDPNPCPMPAIPQHEKGLCILLMDASGSMQSQAFPGSPVSKEDLVAGSASGGIFDLVKTTEKENAYVCGVMFDTETKLVFTETVSDIINKYSGPGDFADFLKKGFSSMHGGTDINKALGFAKGIYDDFVNNGDLSKYNGPKALKPVLQTVYDKDNNRNVVPNIRVFIYTDGMHTESSTIINPFKDEEVDILMGAYFGSGEEEGCRALRKILSSCPKHDFEQFFLINDPRRIQTLRRLFRMASGTSGFCPMCLAEANTEAH